MGRMLVKESDTTEPPRCRMNAATVSPVEYVRSLSPEDKEAVFAELLQEVVRLNGGKGLIPIDNPGGEQLGYFISAEAADALAELELPKLTLEREQELRDRAGRLSTAVPVQQVVAELKERERQAQRR
jgi:hypothetical protein